MPLATVDAAVDGGVDAVHLRDHAAPARALHARGWELKAVLAGRAWLVVNDRLDVAAALGAEGAQLGARSLWVEDARRAAGPLKLGVSVHSADEASAAANVGGADWVVLGSVFTTGSHPGGGTIGVSAVEAARRGVRAPIVAIGGITAGNVDEVLAAGAHGVAVISAIAGAPSPRDAARRLRDRIDARYPA